MGGGNSPHPCCATKGGALRNSPYLLDLKLILIRLYRVSLPVHPIMIELLWYTRVRNDGSMFFVKSSRLL